MNKAKQSGNRRRGYDNTLREEQARQTRQRILEAAVEAFAEDGAEGVTLAQVARAAGVAEPTLYRHFGSRDRLYEEIEAHAQARIGLPPIPENAEELAAHAGAVFEKFGAHARVVQAMVRTGIGGEIRSQGRARRLKQLRAALSSHAPGLDAGSLDRITGIVRILVAWETFEKLTGELGLSTEAAAEAVEWAVETLVGELDGGEEACKPRRARVGGGAGGPSMDQRGKGGVE